MAAGEGSGSGDFFLGGAEFGAETIAALAEAVPGRGLDLFSVFIGCCLLALFSSALTPFWTAPFLDGGEGFFVGVDALCGVVENGFFDGRGGFLSSMKGMVSVMTGLLRLISEDSGCARVVTLWICSGAPCAACRVTFTTSVQADCTFHK